ncbi:hypothetical protein N8152_02720 [bacterium]|nr:hypothetical protein [bacterium]
MQTRRMGVALASIASDISNAVAVDTEFDKHDPHVATAPKPKPKGFPWMFGLRSITCFGAL